MIGTLLSLSVLIMIMLASLLKTNEPILISRASVSFGHVVGETEGSTLAAQVDTSYFHPTLAPIPPRRGVTQGCAQMCNNAHSPAIPAPDVE